MEQIVDEKTVTYWETLLSQFIAFLPKLIFAVVIFIIGIVLAKIIMKIVDKALKKSRIDTTIHSFLKSTIKISMYVIVSIIALSSAGVEMTSIIAIVGAAGLAISLALQNSLSNVAGGFIILFSKPFKKGDYIESNGLSGTVEEISIISTKLLTLDNKVIHIPNGSLSGAVITNYTEEQLRRLDMVFSISYDDDFNQAKEIISRVINNNPLAIKSPEPFIRMGEHAASSINVITRVWVKSEDYWNLNFDLLEQVKAEFDKNNITIPYNQLQVHIDK